MSYQKAKVEAVGKQKAAHGNALARLGLKLLRQRIDDADRGPVVDAGLILNLLLEFETVESCSAIVRNRNPPRRRSRGLVHRPEDNGAGMGSTPS